MYTPDGYIADPPDAKCPYCGEYKKSCSHLDNLARVWAREECKKKHAKKD